jgi:BirA family biotin operon repressor/biotin-[acetyl-CoA-carboxylase] ligase
MTSSIPPIHRFEQVTSTMDVLHEMATKGAEMGTAVVAKEQTGGRGSRGRAWHSPRGGLWLSVLLRPDGEDAAELLALRVGLAVARVLDELNLPRPVRLKWPNDLMVGEQKVGGILCEARWQGEVLGWAAVGIGLNVQNPVPPELEELATSLGQQVERITPESLVDPVINQLRRISQARGMLSTSDVAELRERDWLRGRALRQPIAGQAVGISSEGALLIRRPDGRTVPLRSGTVELADALPTRNFDPCS